MDFYLFQRGYSETSWDKTLSISPKDFIHLNTREQVKDAIHQLFWETDPINEESEETGIIEKEVIPEDFFDEWHKLKSHETIK